MRGWEEARGGEVRGWGGGERTTRQVLQEITHS